MTQEQPREGWGWWTAYDKQTEWLHEVNKHVPWPDENILRPSSGAEVSQDELHAKLLQFGGYLTYLLSNQGVLKGRAKALKETFESAMSATKAKSKLVKSASEAQREAEAFSDPDVGEALRDTKRRQIEIETCIETQDGLIRAYDAAWKTCSRLLTGTIAEMDLASGRTP